MPHPLEWILVAQQVQDVLACLPCLESTDLPPLLLRELPNNSPLPVAGIIIIALLFN